RSRPGSELECPDALQPCTPGRSPSEWPGCCPRRSETPWQGYAGPWTQKRYPLRVTLHVYSLSLRTSKKLDRRGPGKPLVPMPSEPVFCQGEMPERPVDLLPGRCVQYRPGSPAKSSATCNG